MTSVRLQSEEEFVSLEDTVEALAILILVLNLLISWWNTYAVGNAWVEAKHEGGWHYFMCWMGAVMAAVGFTWTISIFVAAVAAITGFLDRNSVEAMLNLTYLLVILPALFACYAITLDSWARAYREKTVADAAVAGYNTFATMYNTYNAVHHLGDAFKDVGDFFKGDGLDSEGAVGFLIIMLVLLSLGLGILITWMFIRYYAAGDEPLPEYPQIQRTSR